MHLPAAKCERDSEKLLTMSIKSYWIFLKQLLQSIHISLCCCFGKLIYPMSPSLTKEIIWHLSYVQTKFPTRSSRYYEKPHKKDQKTIKFKSWSFLLVHLYSCPTPNSRFLALPQKPTSEFKKQTLMGAASTNAHPIRTQPFRVFTLMGWN